MGRPKGSLNKTTIAKMAALGITPGQRLSGMVLPAHVPEKVDVRTDDEIVNEIRDRYEVYRDLIGGTTDSTISSLVVSGSAGVGKSFTAMQELANIQVSQPEVRYRLIKGRVSAIDLYEIAYFYRDPGCVLILDDSDSIFDDEAGLNLLKALLDTSIERKICWSTDHAKFKGDSVLPKEYHFNGSMIFLTNKDFQATVDFGGSHAEHMSAIMSRSLYVDLKMHSRREVILWTGYLVRTYKILQQLGNITADEERMLMQWIVTNMNSLRYASVRSVILLGRLFKRAKESGTVTTQNWERNAKITLLKQTA